MQAALDNNMAFMSAGVILEPLHLFWPMNQRCSPRFDAHGTEPSLVGLDFGAPATRSGVAF
jgi:hypothetical protein